MGVDIQWERLAQPNQTGNLLAGYEAGKAAGVERDTKNALGLYAQGDAEGAYRALMPIDPEKAMAIRKASDAEKREKARTGILSQYGSGDTEGASKAALQSGDVDTLELINKMDERTAAMALKRTEQQATLLMPLLDVPAAERKARIGQLAPQLEAVGFSPEQIAGFDPSDANLNSLVNGVLGIKGQIEQRWKAKEYDLKKTDMEADNRRGDAQLDVSRGQLGVSRSNSARGWASHNERKKAGGFGTPGGSSGEWEEID